VCSHCNRRNLMRWQPANPRGFGDSFLRRPHQNIGRVVNPQSADAGNPLFRQLGKYLCQQRGLTEASHG
jgi:hypothetical protein